MRHNYEKWYEDKLESHGLCSWVGGALAVGGALLGGAASESAANTQANATTQAALIQQQTAQQQIAAQQTATAQERADVQPWRDAGVGGLTLMQGLLGTGSTGMTPAQIMAQDPGYQFRMDQGVQAVKQGDAAAFGPGLGSTTLKDLLTYGQNYASGEFQNIFNNASTLSGSGLGAATGQANFTQAGATNNANTAMTAANNTGNMLTSGAAANAAGTVGVANAFTGAANNYNSQMTLRQILAGNQNTQAQIPQSTTTMPAAVDPYYNADTSGVG